MKIIPESPHLQITHVKCRYFTQVASWLTTCKDLTKYSLHENISPSGTKGFGTHTKHQGGGGGGVKKDAPQYTKNGKCYKPETFRGVRSIL